VNGNKRMNVSNPPVCSSNLQNYTLVCAKYGAALKHKKALGKTAKQSIYSLTIKHIFSYLTEIKVQTN